VKDVILPGEMKGLPHRPAASGVLARLTQLAQQRLEAAEGPSALSIFSVTFSSVSNSFSRISVGLSSISLRCEGRTHGVGSSRRRITLAGAAFSACTNAVEDLLHLAGQDHVLHADPQHLHNPVRYAAAHVAGRCRRPAKPCRRAARQGLRAHPLAQAELQLAVQVSPYLATLCCARHRIGDADAGGRFTRRLTLSRGQQLLPETSTRVRAARSPRPTFFWKFQKA